MALAYPRAGISLNWMAHKYRTIVFILRVQLRKTVFNECKRTKEANKKRGEAAKTRPRVNGKLASSPLQRCDTLEKQIESAPKR